MRSPGPSRLHNAAKSHQSAAVPGLRSNRADLPLPPQHARGAQEGHQAPAEHGRTRRGRNHLRFSGFTHGRLRFGALGQLRCRTPREGQAAHVASSRYFPMEWVKEAQPEKIATFLRCEIC
eukprot:scaffold1793_cov245-Pinguiococcus_pyrenoidosus.AAC.2